MALSAEWKSRVELWLKALEECIYEPKGLMEWKGFQTKTHLSLKQAEAEAAEPFPEGTCWGEQWAYGWFFTQVQIPQELSGKRIAMDIQLGGESTLFVDGCSFGTRRDDWVSNRLHFICDNVLTDAARGGENFSIAAECYGGHNMPLNRGSSAPGPLIPGHEEILPQEGARRQVGRSTWGVWNEEAYQLYMDVRTVLGNLQCVDPDSLRAMDLEKALKAFSCTVDFEQPYEIRQKSFRLGREVLRPVLACKNGSTMPVMHAMGHAHIDVAWLWPLEETDRKCSRTFAAQLRHMEEYPEYTMIQSQPYLYQRTKELYPELFDRMKEKVKQGQLIPEGGMWVEADTNIPSGESLIRQFLYGKAYFKKEFGVEDELLWLPDVFGYTAALPQIMKGCGIRYFSTHKIFWTYNGGDPFPYHSFMWKGIDGTEIPSFIHVDYNSETDPETLHQRWKKRAQKENLRRFLLPFGYGDGGGGPSRDHIEFCLREKDLEGVPQVKFDTPKGFFEALEQDGEERPTYVGELYFQAHRGTYTSQAAIKKGNRQNETGLGLAEFWSAAACAFKGAEYPADELEKAWKMLLVNQFHDILPGSSIGRVYERARREHSLIREEWEKMAQEALSALTEEGEGLSVFNSLPWERKALVKVPEGWQGAEENGCPLPIQKREDGLYAEANIPSCGWATLKPAGVYKEETAVKASESVLENELLSVSINAYGEITRILDKETGQDWIAGPCNRLKMYQDIPGHYDAWDIDSVYMQNPVELPEKAVFLSAESGPLFGAVCFSRKIHDSELIQTILLRKGSRTVEFRTKVQWKETHKLLKVEFPVQVYGEEALHEIQFGYVKRPNHASRKYDADRFEVCNHRWTALTEALRGCAVLNDCKYGVNVLGNTIALTLLKAAAFPDAHADQGEQEFTYAFHCWNTDFGRSDVVKAAHELNVPVLCSEGVAGTGSLFTLSSGTVILENVKCAEDGNGFILRLYESKGSACRETLHLGFDAAEASVCNFIEEGSEMLEIAGNALELEFTPFQVRTIRVVPR